MKLTFNIPAKRFVAECSYEQREIPRKAGFWWDATLKRWVTSEVRTALALREYADDQVKKILNKFLIEVTPFEGAVLHSENKTPKEYQKDIVKWCLTRNRSLVAADPGLGKSAIAAMIAATSGKHVLFICPSFLKLTIEREFREWCPRPSAVTVLPDTMLEKSLGERLLSTKPKDTILVVDECHRVKNFKAKRTIAVFKKFLPKFDRAIFMSGTPMPNRPLELYPLLSNAAPEVIDFMTMHEYAVKYCDAYEGEFGWDYNGASNTEELFARMREKFMIRVKKEDVLKDLPPKVEELLILDHKEPPRLELLSRKAVDEIKSDDVSAVIGSTVVATYRRELGEYVAPLAARAINEYLENSSEAILVFAHHKSVVDILRKELAEHDPFVITGETPTQLRQGMVDEFQSLVGTDRRRVVIGNILAAGVGLTMTRATRVIFVESDWTPGNNSQASDRAHRIGQTGSVFIQHCVLPNSLGANIMSSVLRKQTTINKL